MSNRRVPLEQPPYVEDQLLQEWLSRMMIMINAAFDQVQHYDPIGVIPDKVSNGDLYYFNQIILPEITAAGPWMYVEGVWTNLA